jgi:hypothetical protein
MFFAKFIGTSICGFTSDGRKTAQFFRVTAFDLPYFPVKTFSSLAMIEGKHAMN